MKYHLIDYFSGEPGITICSLIFFVHVFWKRTCDDNWRKLLRPPFLHQH